MASVSDAETESPAKEPTVTTGRLYCMLFTTSCWAWLALFPPAFVGATPMITFLFFGFIMNEHAKWIMNPEYSALHEIQMFCIYLLVVGVASGICKCLSVVAWVRLGCKFSVRLKSQLFSKLMTSDVTFFDSHSVGSLLTLLNEDAVLVQEAFGSIKVQQISSLTQCIIAICLAYAYSWKQALVATAAVPLIMITIYLFGLCITRRTTRKFSHVSESMTIAQETLAAIKTVRSFNSENDEAARFSSEIRGAEHEDHWIEGLLVIMLTLVYFMVQGLVTADLYWAGKLVQQKSMTSGDLMSLFGYLLFGVAALIEFQGSLQGEQKAIAAGKRILEMIDSESNINFDGGAQLDHCRGEIEFRNVSFRYPSRDTHALIDVSFKIESGQIVALVGHSGSGKTTCVQLLERYYDVTDGMILIDGHDIKELDPRWLHQVMGLISQEPVLFQMSVKDNIKYGNPNASDEEVEAAAEVANAKKFIMKMENGFDQMIGPKGSTLSGGQRQRIAIARAVIRDPVILIADEATSALDARSEKKVQEALEQVMVTRTCLVVAHRLSTIRNASLIHVFESGRIIEVGNHEDLISRHGAYYELVRRQLGKQELDVG